MIPGVLHYSGPERYPVTFQLLELLHCVASPPILSCPSPTHAVLDPMISMSRDIPARTVIEALSRYLERKGSHKGDTQTRNYYIIKILN